MPVRPTLTYILLLTLTHKDTVTRLASCGADYTFKGESYTATDLKFENAKASSQVKKTKQEGISLALPDDLAISQYIQNLQYPEKVNAQLIILADTGSSQEVVVNLRGSINTLSTETRMLRITIASIVEGLNHAGLHLVYSQTCNYQLYSPACGAATRTQLLTVNQAYEAARGGGYLLESNSLSIVGSTVGIFGTTSAVADLPVLLKNSFIRIGDRQINIVYAGQSQQNPGNLLLLLPRKFENLTGKIITLFLGCDLTLTDCFDKFNNTQNFGGFPFFTGKTNPFKNDISGGNT